MAEPKSRPAHVLSRAETLVLSALALGEPCDLSKLPDRDSAIRGYVLSEMISHASEEDAVKRSALILVDARIIGDFDLSTLEIRVDLIFVDCEFLGAIDVQRSRVESMEIYGGSCVQLLADSFSSKFEFVFRNVECSTISLKQARLCGIDLRGTVVSSPVDVALIADNAEIEGDFRASDHFQSHGQLRMRFARIHGQFNLDGSSITSNNGIALDATGVQIEQGFSMGRGFQALGEVRVLKSVVRGTASFSGGSFSNPSGDSIDASRTSFSSGLQASSGFESTGEFKLIGATIVGPLILAGAKLMNPGGDALSADGAKISGGVIANKGLVASGSVSLYSASIDGQVSFEGARIENLDGVSLDCSQVRIGGGLYLADGFASSGRVDVSGAVVKGQVSLREASLSNPHGVAFIADGAQFDRSLTAGDGFSAVGEVRMVAAEVGGQLSLDSAKFSNPGGNSFIADRIIVRGTWFAGKGLTSEGEFRAGGAEVEAQCLFDGGNFVNPGQDALSLDGTRIRGNLSLCEEFKAEGQVRLPGVDVGGQFSIQKGEFRNPGEIALGAEKMTVAGIAFVSEFTYEGGVNFSASQFETSMLVARVSGTGPVVFGECRFNGASTFHLDLRPNERFSLEGSQFDSPATVRVMGESGTPGLSLPQLNASRIQAVGSVSISGAWFGVNLDHARFLRVSSLVGESDTAHSTAGAILLSSVDGCSLSNLELNGVDLSICEFAGAYDIDGLRVSGNNRLPTAPNPDQQREVIYDEVLYRANVVGDTRWKSKVNAGYGKASRTDARVVEAAYRSLRHALESSSNAPGASGFYFGEMEMRRLGPSTPLPTKALITLYRFVSGYATRPLDAAVVMWMLFALSMGAWALKLSAPASSNCSVDLDANGFSTLIANFGHLPGQLSLSIREPGVCTASSLLLALLGVAFAVVALLFAVAVRSRVKR